MKKISKILSIILSIMMIISIVPLTASAATSGTCGDNLKWTYDTSTYTLTISGTGAMRDYDYNNRPWESYKSSIKTVVIDDSVTTIGDYAFYRCYSLISVTIGDSVTTIGDVAFAECTSLKSVTIGDSVTTIGNGAFEYCDNLTSVTIGDSITTIGDNAFSCCDRLASIKVDGNNQYYSNDECGVLFNKGKTTLIQYPAGNTRTNYTIPNSLITIVDYAFYNCDNLTSVTISDSVTTIGDWVFYSCDNLTSVTIGDNVTTIGEYAFCKCTNLTNVIIPDGVTKIVDSAFYGCSSLTSVTIPDSVTTIGEEAFCNCDSLTSVTIGDGVTIIYSWAFYGCYSLTDVYYSGTEEEWNDILVGISNDSLFIATTHYNYPVHNYKTVVTLATCTQSGYTTYTCECGDIYIANIIPATGHADNDGDGYCDACLELLDPTVGCECNCHKSGISNFFFKFALFFQRIFGSNKYCSCGVAHY